jgi:hypothetical protein
VRENSNETISTISSSIKCLLPQISNQVGLLQLFCKQVTERCNAARLIFNLMLQKRYNQHVPIDEYSQFNLDNFFQRMVLYEQPYKPRESNENPIKQQEIDDTARELFGEDSPPMPDHAQAFRYSSCLLAIELQTEIKNNLDWNLLEWQLQAITIILRKTLPQFQTDDLTQQQQEELELLCMFIRKECNKWNFKHSCDTLDDSKKAAVRNVIDEFKALARQVCQINDPFIGRSSIKKLGIDQKLYFAHSIIRITRKFTGDARALSDISVVTKQKNQIRFVPFDSNALSSFFTTQDHRVFDIFDVVDFCKFNISNRIVHGQLKTDGFAVKVLFYKSNHFSGPIKHVKQFIQANKFKTKCSKSVCISIIAIVILLNKNSINNAWSKLDSQMKYVIGLISFLFCSITQTDFFNSEFSYVYY